MSDHANIPWSRLPLANGKPLGILSLCCAAPVYVEASHMDDAERASHWYACSKCGKPCGVKG